MLPKASAYASPAMPEGVPPLKVAELLELCNSFFSGMYVRIEGEVASYSVSRGKFVFFDLKDEGDGARVSAFMMLHQLSSPLEDGMRVVVEAKPGIHSKNGQFKLVVQRVEPVGQGSVKRAFDLLQAKLKAEGLFDAARKRQLPRYPSRIGIISSADAAGFGDFKKIAFSRLPGVSFVLANVAVQGKDAEREIIAAFDHLNGHYALDAVALIRGGGSMEDLHAFNSEIVARAIVRSKVPVVVGVGHERDVTIADFCADVRAATPSNAAQLLLPETSEVEAYVTRLTQDGRRRVERTIHVIRERIMGSLGRSKERTLYRVQSVSDKVSHTMRTIAAISPQETLKRGYTITCGPDGKLVRTTADAPPGSALVTRTAEGLISSTVNS